MRKKIKSLFITAMCLCMVACTNTPSSSVISTSNINADAAVAVTLQSMQILQRSPWMGEGNSFGYYYIDTRSDFSYNIRYIDYATKLDVVLCNRPECTHSDETCGGWGSPNAATPLFYLTGEKIYLLYNGGGWGYVDIDGETYPHIESMDLNGGNRTTLFTAQANQTIGGLHVMNEDVFLTFLHTTHQKGDGVVTEREVVTINRHTGHLETLFSMEDMTEFVGVTENGMLWLRYVYDESSGYNTAYFRFLEEVNLQTQEVRLVRQWGSQEPEPLFQNQYGFALTKEKGVERFNIESGEATLLCGQYTSFTTNSSHLNQIFSDTLVITDSRWKQDGEMDNGQSLVNLHTGHTTDTTLTYITGPEGGTYPLPVKVMAEADDKFLVMVGAKVKPVSYDDGSGNPIVLPHPVEEYAMIIKSNFWNNNPQYELITRID